MSSDRQNHDIIGRIDATRLADALWRLVRIPSPTGSERGAAYEYGEMLREVGMSVEVLEDIPDSPSVVGRMSGSRPGKTLQLAGHLDHIDVTHPEPSRNDKRITGRGSADMKCGLAGAVEIARVLAADEAQFAGDLLVTAYGLHEAPTGHAEGIASLIKKKIVGDAAIVLEGPKDQVIIKGKGQSIWNIGISRSGDACHELRRDPLADGLLASVQSVLGALWEKKTALSADENGDELLGTETLFVGQVHYGDFYNRAPKHATLQGTWRWLPERSFADVQRDLKDLLSSPDIAKGVGEADLRIEDSWVFVGDSYSISTDEPVVRSIRNASREMLDDELELAGSSAINDASKLVPWGGIPTVPLGIGGTGAHADFEYVDLDELVRGCGLVLRAALNFFGE